MHDSLSVFSSACSQDLLKFWSKTAKDRGFSKMLVEKVFDQKKFLYPLLVNTFVDFLTIVHTWTFTHLDVLTKWAHFDPPWVATTPLLESGRAWTKNAWGVTIFIMQRTINLFWDYTTQFSLKSAEISFIQPFMINKMKFQKLLPNKVFYMLFLSRE